MGIQNHKSSILGEQEMSEKFKCYNCGKCFKDNSKLTRHKNRKTPCLIAEVKPEDIDNPNRCIFCNRILANKRNLERHYERCKVKNKKSEVLMEKKFHELFAKSKQEQEEQIKFLFMKMTELEAKLKCDNVIVNGNANTNTVNNANTNTVNNVNMNTVNNNANTNTVNIIIPPNATGMPNDWRNPTLWFPDMQEIFYIAESTKMMLALMKLVYFNPSKPENHSILPIERDHAFLREDEHWNLYKLTNTMLVNLNNKLEEIKKNMFDDDDSMRCLTNYCMFADTIEEIPEKFRDNFIDFINGTAQTLQEKDISSEKSNQIVKDMMAKCDLYLAFAFQKRTQAALKQQLVNPSKN